ncbi:hypothetical protein QR680_018941 [Steinernema hermaphroditum]|uniref:Uncharacterized protein n=1 Tax=Steinernema hermaphroditum TaxID=289476 RepID=A0AA39HJH5_9BILA|nr:hypothetical protein QR680_018941 [Steinernema hermaphroditum]
MNAGGDSLELHNDHVVIDDQEGFAVVVAVHSPVAEQRAHGAEQNALEEERPAREYVYDDDQSTPPNAPRPPVVLPNAPQRPRSSRIRRGHDFVN